MQHKKQHGQKSVGECLLFAGAFHVMNALLLCTLTLGCSDGDSGDVGNSDTDSDSDVDSDTDTENYPWIPGISAAEQTDLPDGEPVACEWDWTIRLLAPHPDYEGGHPPRRMYFASCDLDTWRPKLLSSYTLGTKEDAGYLGTSGAVTMGELNPSTGALEISSTYHFPECRSMHGIAASSDCSIVGVLCRIENSADGEDFDPVASYPGSDWITNENMCGDKMNDHMWLYEWTGGDLSEAPTKVIVHKSIGSWEYGENYLRLGENDNTYGIALKTTVGEQPDCHEADSFMVLDRSDYSFTDRGWDWACATGHTIHNRPAYDPVSKKYAMLCSTDWNQENIADLTELAYRTEESGKTVIQHIPRYSALWIKGGAGPIIPREDGGFIGIFVGEPPPQGAGYDDTTPVQLGLVRFDSSGEQEGEVKWVASHDTAYYSWPQLAQLGKNRYLLGWGEGTRVGEFEDLTDRNLSLRIPWTYWVMEIDGEGNPLTEATELLDAGWGEVNEMVPFGEGRVAWSYVPEDRRIPGSNETPPCNQDTLVHYVYTSELK